VTSKEHLETILALNRGDEYAPSHAFAAALMSAPGAERCDGLRWPSCQCSDGEVILLFDPRATPDYLAVLEEKDLATDFTLLDEALQAYGYTRYGRAAVAREALTEDAAAAGDPRGPAPDPPRV